MYPYKHIMCISRWNDVETVVSTSFQLGVHVVVSRDQSKIIFKDPLYNQCLFNLIIIFY